MMKWAEHVAYLRRSECIQVFDGEILRKDITWKTSSRWEDNTKIE